MVWALVALSLAGCSALPWVSEGPTLYSPVYGSAALGQVGLSQGDLWSVGDIPLCLDEAGSVTITRVELVAPSNDLSVAAFAVRTVPIGKTPRGGGLGDLSTLGMTRAEQKVHTVTNICDEQSRANVGLDGAPPEGTPVQRVGLAVTVTSTVLPAQAQALRIYYLTPSGKERSTTSPVALDMCAGKIGDDCPPSD